ncbi:MAG TPA: radical SAM family heme chaperone HemW [Perlabentimonas sp.]|nr:radical SAM family heme chaperone HemW [Tenuifilaceae bacterium]HZJ74345.1 radical SAM family heme chaperone HemW [Perlabentimonas sp.]
MSGIYIHVPYCKRKCSYCDFYSVANDSGKNEFANLIEKEIELRASYLNKSPVETIYFGGGTPSTLTTEAIGKILNAISKHFTVAKNSEVTLEANPDDLSIEYLLNLQKIGVNRLSIGVQSLCDSDLKQLGRRHNATEAINATNHAKKVGFSNISIDLIYGLPYSSNQIWEHNLAKAFALPITHLSCYHLIYESGTPLHKNVKSGLVKPVDENISVEQFKLLQQYAQQFNFEHYEVSNLSKKEYRSRHNTSYWKQIHYLGLGPSAHSYNGVSRCWNARSIEQWGNSIKKGLPNPESETLTKDEKINEYFLTSLRTIWGADLSYISNNYGKASAELAQKMAVKYAVRGKMAIDGNIIRIKPEHFLTSDGIIIDFLV